jgi:hypothetical protein
MIFKHEECLNLLILCFNLFNNQNGKVSGENLITELTGYIHYHIDF